MKTLRVLLDQRLRLRTALLLVATLVAALLEMAGIGAIPAFIALWASPERLLAALPDWTGTVKLRGMEQDRLILISAVLLAGLFLLKNAFLAALHYMEGRVLRDVSTRLSSRLFRTYLFSPYTFHLERNPAQLIRNISQEISEAVHFLGNGMTLIREGLVLAVVFLLLLLVDPVVSLSVFVLLGAAAGAFYLAVRQALGRRGELAQEHRGGQIQAVQQGLGGIKDARLLGRELNLLRTFDSETQAMEGHAMFNRVVARLPRLFLEVVAVMAVLLVAAGFILLGRSTQAMLPVLALLGMAVVRLVPALNATTAALALMRYQGPSVRLIVEELDSQERSLSEAGPDLPCPVLDEGTTITLRDVHFQYPRGQAALRGVSLEIRAGEAVGIIGPSGAGKSTLIDVILGLLTPSAGVVEVGGLDIQSRLRGWQRQIGYVPQSIYLMDDTIRNNIAFGLQADEIDEHAVTKAVRAARLDAFVWNLPDGLDTVVGDRGIRLSGGQRQRIGIARALYHDPRVLVFDEATSALDDETEREVIDAIARLRGHRTLITIAHRLTTVAGCDVVYLLRDGSLSDQGTLAELTARHEQLKPGVWNRLPPEQDDSGIAMNSFVGLDGGVR